MDPATVIVAALTAWSETMKFLGSTGGQQMLADQREFFGHIISKIGSHIPNADPATPPPVAKG